jgi:hypothetical protein
MTYTEFWAFVDAECMHETIYDDSDGRAIMVIRMIDLWSLANKFKQKEKANEATDITQKDQGGRQLVQRGDRGSDA